jgi:hypothetical protein
MNFELNNALAKQIAINLAATPITFGKSGLTHKDLLTTNTLQILDDNNNIQKIKTWYGEAIGSEGIVCCLLTILNNTEESFEIAFVLTVKDQNINSDNTIIGYKFDYLDVEDIGQIFIKLNNKWIQNGLIERLKITLSFEIMNQEGVIWNPIRDIPELLWDNLSEIIEK